MTTFTDSIAGRAFDDALAVMASMAFANNRVRVPYDYTPTLPDTGNHRWEPPRALLPGEARGAIGDATSALRRRAVSAAELVQDALAAGRAAAHLGVIVEECPDAIRHAEARDAELAAGLDRGPLHGIPVTVKDVIDVAGVPTRAGSEAYLAVPDTDAVAVARLEAAGAIVIAKVSTHEFALGVTTPQSRNPHDPTRIPGGSSGGSAAAVVVGAGLGSLGTDTRASIRVPAALSGAVGFKPTYGRVPTEGVVSLSWTMDHVAPLAPSVTDAALMLDAMIGGTSHLAWTPQGDTSRVRVGVVGAGFAGTEPGVHASVEDAIGRLRGDGFPVDASALPDAADLELANAVGLVVSRCEAAAAHRGLGLDRSRYWQEVREQLDHADAVRAVDYLDAQRLRCELRRRLQRAFEHHDVLVMPTVPVVAPLVEDFAGYLMLLARNAIPWSLVGFPAMSVPVQPVGGLPVGIQLVAAPYREDLLVEVGRAIEREQGLRS